MPDTSLEFQRDLAQFIMIISRNGSQDSKSESETVSYEAPVISVANLAISQIQHDMAEGTIPKTVRMFSELHDYLDANAYGRAFEWPCSLNDTDDSKYVQLFTSFWNDVQNRVDDWLQKSNNNDAPHPCN